MLCRYSKICRLNFIAFQDAFSYHGVKIDTDSLHLMELHTPPAHPHPRFTSVLIFSCWFLLSNVPSPAAFAQSFGPAWAKDAVVYEIFPERFANGDTTNDPPEVQPWGDKPTSHGYFGGDLRGIRDHLDYIQDLGVNTIYFTPIFESPTNHKYQTTDYFKIDSHFGTLDDFTRLLNECHARGIRVILDGVFNHTGRDFFAFKDILEHQEKSPYTKWYDIYDFPVRTTGKPNYESFWGIGSLPKLSADNPDVRKYLFDVTSFWMSKGIDGWRLDVADGLSHDFWKAWRKLVKSSNPEAYVAGEIWDDASPWLRGDEFDGVMNYRFRGACVGFLALENRTAVQCDSLLDAVETMYPAGCQDMLWNLIGSHDTERFLTLCNGDADKMKLAVLLQMTYRGMPMIYYGDEIGMVGGKDPDCRRTMIWDSTQWNMGLLHWYKRLIGIRRDYAVFRDGNSEILKLPSAKSMLAFSREDSMSNAIVFINSSSERERLVPSEVVNAQSSWLDLLTNRKYRSSDTLSLDPRSGVILFTQKGM